MPGSMRPELERAYSRVESVDSAGDAFLESTGEVCLLGARKPGNTLTSAGEWIRCTLTDAR